MTNDELWQAIYANNKRQQVRERKLVKAQGNLSAIRDLLPPPGKIIPMKEVSERISKIWSILEALDD